MAFGRPGLVAISAHWEQKGLFCGPIQYRPRKQGGQKSRGSVLQFFAYVVPRDRHSPSGNTHRTTGCKPGIGDIAWSVYADRIDLSASAACSPQSSLAAGKAAAADKEHPAIEKPARHDYRQLTPSLRTLQFQGSIAETPKRYQFSRSGNRGFSGRFLLLGLVVS